MGRISGNSRRGTVYTAVESVERQIKCTKKFKLNANKNDVKFNSIQFI